MVGAEATAGCDQEVGLIARTDERHHFVDDVALVLVVAHGAVVGWDAPVVPTLAVDAIHAEELQPPLLQMGGQRAHHAEILVLVKPAHGGREDQDRRAGVPEDEHLHIASQGRAGPALVLTLHGYGYADGRPKAGSSSRAMF